MISNANGTHDNYQRILGPFPYDAAIGFCWFLNGWKLEQIESTLTNVSLSSCFWTKLNLYRKNRKWIKWNLTYELRYKIQIHCCMYNLIPRASCLSDVGRQGLSIIGLSIMGHLNSICNKFEMLPMWVVQHVDILMLSETKLDSPFLSIQFLINGFSVPHRLDQNSKGGSILLYVRDQTIVLPLNRYSLPLHIKVLFF